MSDKFSIARIVVVTRPLAQARILQSRLQTMGRQVELFPLLEIHPLTNHDALDLVLASLERFALVVFVSPNAIAAAFARCKQWPAHVPLAVMGAGSLIALAEQGVDRAITPVFSPKNLMRTDSQTLLEVLDLSALHGRDVLIVRGESGRELLGDALRAAGAIVTQIASYRRAAPIADPDRLQRLNHLLANDCDWLITSSEALQILVEMVRGDGPEQEAHGRVARLQQQTLIVPHARIAETAESLGFMKVIQSGSGDDRMLTALQFAHE
jgi:uroporphyrinogen-III synthase